MKLSKMNQLSLECFLVVLIIGMTVLMDELPGYKILVMNLYFLPAMLGAFFVGRYRAGVIALLCVVCVTIVAGLDLEQFVTSWSPMATVLAITIWAATLGLTTILAGTLSDERSTQTTELHEAYIGVIEVLSKYLHSVQPGLKERPTRIANMSEQMGEQLRLSDRELDDIRVASLLQEMDHIEITAKVVRKALGTTDLGNQKAAECTFHASDLVQSLGTVLNGALPLLCGFDESMNLADSTESKAPAVSLPLGAQIIRAARDYDSLVFGQNSVIAMDPSIAVTEMLAGKHGAHSVEVLGAMERIVNRQTASDGKARALGMATTKPAATPTAPTATAS
jgi:hypothetical protein